MYDDWDGVTVLTRPQAEAVLAEAQALDTQGWYGQPMLYGPGHEGDFWCIWWEDGPQDWAYEFFTKHSEVFAEPVNGMCLALHPNNF